MIKFKVHSKPQPTGYRNEFVLAINGYWGDGDEYYHTVESFDPQNTIQKASLEVTTHYFHHVYRNIKPVLETYEQYEEWAASNGYDPDLCDPPVDIANMLISGVDEFELVWYDDNGLAHKVEIIDE